MMSSSVWPSRDLFDGVPELLCDGVGDVVSNSREPVGAGPACVASAVADAGAQPGRDHHAGPENAAKAAQLAM